MKYVFHYININKYVYLNLCFVFLFMLTVRNCSKENKHKAMLKLRYLTFFFIYLNPFICGRIITILPNSVIRVDLKKKNSWQKRFRKSKHVENILAVIEKRYHKLEYLMS